MPEWVKQQELISYFIGNGTVLTFSPLTVCWTTKWDCSGKSIATKYLYTAYNVYIIYMKIHVNLCFIRASLMKIFAEKSVACSRTTIWVNWNKFPCGAFYFCRNIKEKFQQKGEKRTPRHT